MSAEGRSATSAGHASMSAIEVEQLLGAGAEGESAIGSAAQPAWGYRRVVRKQHASRQLSRSKT